MLLPKKPRTSYSSETLRVVWHWWLHPDLQLELSAVRFFAFGS